MPGHAVLIRQEPRSALLHRQRTAGEPRVRKSPRALSAAEKKAVLDVLHSERFVDSSPEQVYAILLDEGQYLCSVRTMYRLLKEQGESRERRAVTARPSYKKPELLATGPRQVWSWDITRLKGPETWQWFYLYVILDHFDGMESATSFCRGFFKWYNQEHRHSGLGMMTPLAVHEGLATQLREQRKVVLARAFECHPERFVKGLPQPAPLPIAAWINPPVSPEKSAEPEGPEEVVAKTVANSWNIRSRPTG